MEKCVNCGKENLEAFKGGYNIEAGFSLCMDCHTKYKNGDEEINKKFDEFLESKPDLKAKINKEREEKKRREEEQRRKEEEKAKSQIDCFYCGKKSLGFFNRLEMVGGVFLCTDCNIKYENGDEELKEKFNEFLETKPDLKDEINKEMQENEILRRFPQIKKDRWIGYDGFNAYCIGVTVAKYHVEKAGLDWNDVVEKLTKNGWAMSISSTMVRLTADLGALKDSMSKVFGDNFYRILPILQKSHDNKEQISDEEEEEKKEIKEREEILKILPELKNKGCFKSGDVKLSPEDIKIYLPPAWRYCGKCSTFGKYQNKCDKCGSYNLYYMYPPKNCMKHRVKNAVRTCYWCRKNFCDKCITKEIDGYYCEVCLIAKKSIQKQAKILACDYAVLKKEYSLVEEGLTGDIGTRSQGVGLGIGGIGIGVGDSKGKINLSKTHKISFGGEERSICFLILTDKGIFELPLSMIMEKYEVTYGLGKDSEKYLCFDDDSVALMGYSLYVLDKAEWEKDERCAKSYFLEHESVYEWSKIMEGYEKKAKEEQKENAFLKAKNSLEEGGKKTEKEKKLRGKEKIQKKEEDIPEKIKKLAELRDKGILTCNEFKKKKKELIERI